SYARYVLAVLTVVYVFNFIDRQILSILAPEIQRELGISDADMAFLYGTAFAVFYAVFGIPLGRLADVWTRRSLIAIGLAVWSGLTALSGTARSFATLAVYRIGVGIGEASASPAAFSLLGDWFEPRRRGFALAVYSSGVYIGAGIGIFLGGWIVEGWQLLYPEGGAPFGLRGWQVAFFAVGLPGLAVALWVHSLREPRRGQSEGMMEVAPHPHPFREFGSELFAVLPPFTLVSLARLGGGRAVAANLVGAVAVAVAAAGLAALTGDPVQWIALGIGCYCAISWAQGLGRRDPVAFALIFRSRALPLLAVGFASISFVTYGFGFWGPSFFVRVHGVSEGEVGTVVGLSAAVGGWLGVSLGGLLSDHLKLRAANGRIWVGWLTALLSLPSGWVLLHTESLILAYVMNFLFAVTSPLWLGAAASAVNELVLPRLRALASAFYILLLTFIGLALGPYTMGLLSDVFAAGGADSGIALRDAMSIGLGMFFVSAVVLAGAARFLPTEEASRVERARAAGEPV
ncbi:MAG: MFS transporter, partial [Myxococcota bacterium]